jgi:hypothetical protein
MSTTGELKPKIDRTKYIIQDKKGETIIKKTGDIDGYNFKLRNLDNCTVYLMDWTKGVLLLLNKLIILKPNNRCSSMIAQNANL